MITRVFMSLLLSPGFYEQSDSLSPPGGPCPSAPWTTSHHRPKSVGKEDTPKWQKYIEWSHSQQIYTNWCTETHTLRDTTHRVLSHYRAFGADRHWLKPLVRFCLFRWCQSCFTNSGAHRGTVPDSSRNRRFEVCFVSSAVRIWLVFGSKRYLWI